MESEDDPTQDILADLRALTLCERAEAFACIVARREHGARSVDIDRPQLAVVLQGRKRVRCGANEWEFAPGDLFLTITRCALDVVNIPDTASGVYLTLAIPLCEEVLDAARLIWAAPVTQSDAKIAHLGLSVVRDDLLRWCAAIRADRASDARLALTALLLRLCHQGYAAILAPPPPSIAAQVREIVSAQPARHWRSRDFEDALGCSSATLRRRLAIENTRLRDVIASARLASAMQLLYTTRWPVKTVAARVGYRSTTSFVRRFTERYGLEPARIGNG